MNLNEQIPLKRVSSDGQVLSTHSIFHTIQGEGPFTGRPAVFVRLAGCNLQCPGCDTEYTKGALDIKADILVDIVKTVIKGKCNLVVITGGEPFRQNITPFTDLLIAEGFKVQIETNGTLAPSPRLSRQVAVVCSPKTGGINAALIPYITAWKYVGRASELLPDGLPQKALGHKAVPYLKRPQGSAPVYLQAMDEQDAELNAANQAAVVASCLTNGYRLCIQIHKLIGVE